MVQCLIEKPHGTIVDVGLGRGRPRKIWMNLVKQDVKETSTSYREWFKQDNLKGEVEEDNGLSSQVFFEGSWPGERNYLIHKYE